MEMSIKTIINNNLKDKVIFIIDGSELEFSYINENTIGYKSSFTGSDITPLITITPTPKLFSTIFSNISKILDEIIYSDLNTNNGNLILFCIRINRLVKGQALM